MWRSASKRLSIYPRCGDLEVSLGKRVSLQTELHRKVSRIPGVGRSVDIDSACRQGKSSEDSVLVACDQGNYHCAGDLRLNSLLHIAKCPILSAESWHVLLGKS